MAKHSLDTPLAHTSLSTRIVNALENADVSTIRQLVGLTWAELIRIRGLGRKSRRELSIFMNAEDLKFGMLKSKAPDSPRSEVALERIATALEVLAMSAMWRDNGMNAQAGFATSINIAADHFREARDA